MATVLRKAWDTILNRASSSSNSLSRNPSYTESSSTEASLGEFDRIPMDIVIQIVKSLGPKEATRLSVLCKSWRSVVSDNRLWIYFLQNYHESWDSVFFSETQLRSGYPIQTYSTLMSTELSFRRIYGQREQVPGCVIIDGGSGYCKFGWSKYACPSGRSATFLEFGNIESPMYSRLRHFYATIYSRMQVRTSTQPIVVSLPICHYDDTEAAKASRRQLKAAIKAALFDMNAPAVCAINQSTLALFAARRTSGIAVNIGFQVTSVVPILNGKVMRKVGVEVIGIGALKVTGFLREQMQQNNISFESLYTIRALKENLCYVANDYEAELSKDTKASLEVQGEGQFTLSKERFKTGEILFQPRLAGVRAMGLHQAVALCMDHCHAAELTADESWYKTVVLSGGTACLPGLAERLEKELCGQLPESISHGIRVIPPPYGGDTAWFGAKLISNLSTFPNTWCVTKKQFKQKSRFNLAW
ncbi:actin-related protein 8 [Mercurialis annua]|uniref:actin-related protein 8 n=1 Tax=Mercurialis annua TaxID=3986 RepID=UPI00215E529E|nr:actin-related protein 8 [Mercurialis annua]